MKIHEAIAWSQFGHFLLLISIFSVAKANKQEDNNHIFGHTRWKMKKKP